MVISSNSKNKTEFICVIPKSNEAKCHFINDMDKLHSCRVKNRINGKVFLESISGRYFFWMREISDDNWEVIK